MNFEFLIALFAILTLIGMLLSYLSSLVTQNEDSLEKRIENLLPNINCGQCGFVGCQGYAKALAKGESSCNLCKPAGADVAKQLAQMTGITEESSDDYEAQLFTPKEVAYIDNVVCNGCDRCKKVCPVDAITGAIKQPHYVDKQECIACDECVKTCPQKCISMMRLEKSLKHFDWNIYSVQSK